MYGVNKWTHQDWLNDGWTILEHFRSHTQLGIKQSILDDPRQQFGDGWLRQEHFFPYVQLVAKRCICADFAVFRAIKNVVRGQGFVQVKCLAIRSTSLYRQTMLCQHVQST